MFGVLVGRDGPLSRANQCPVDVFGGLLVLGGGLLPLPLPCGGGGGGLLGVRSTAMGEPSELGRSGLGGTGSSVPRPNLSSILVDISTSTLVVVLVGEPLGGLFWAFLGGEPGGLFSKRVSWAS